MGCGVLGVGTEIQGALHWDLLKIQHQVVVTVLSRSLARPSLGFRVCWHAGRIEAKSMGWAGCPRARLGMISKRARPVAEWVDSVILGNGPRPIARM
jgi:hypothetical protein